MQKDFLHHTILVVVGGESARLAGRKAGVYKPRKATPVVLGKMQESVSPALRRHPEHDLHSTMQICCPLLAKARCDIELADASLDGGEQPGRELTTKTGRVRRDVPTLARSHLGRVHPTGNAVITPLRVRPEEQGEVGQVGADLGSDIGR